MSDKRIDAVMMAIRREIERAVGAPRDVVLITIAPAEKDGFSPVEIASSLSDERHTMNIVKALVQKLERDAAMRKPPGRA
jgi:hypothetical protein